jgi:hypothetical protein
MRPERAYQESYRHVPSLDELSVRYGDKTNTTGWPLPSAP